MMTLASIWFIGFALHLAALNRHKMFSNGQFIRGILISLAWPWAYAFVFLWCGAKAVAGVIAANLGVLWK